MIITIDAVFGGRVIWFCVMFVNLKYLSRHWGFVAHPENCGKYKGGRKRKWDYGRVYKLRDITGWGCRKLSRVLGIPENSVSQILAKARKEVNETTQSLE